MNTIELMRPGRRSGLVISKEHYETLCEFIINVLESEGEITLTELLETAEEKLRKKFTSQVQWIVLNVKHDLEARGFVKVRHRYKCVQTISIKENQRRSIGLFLRTLVSRSEGLVPQEN